MTTLFRELRSVGLALEALHDLGKDRVNTCEMVHITKLDLILSGAMLLPPVSVFCAEREIPFTATFAQLPVPVYQNGYLISRDRESSGVTLYPKDGGKLRVEVNTPEGASFIVRQCAVGLDGRIALSGSYRVDDETRSAVALRRIGAEEQKLIFPEMFGVGWLALLDSGDVVLAGRQFDKAKNTVPGSNAMRVYSPEGVLKASGLTEDLMRPRAGVSMADAYLWTAGERVRLISALSRRIYEFDSALREIASAPLPPLVGVGSLYRCAGDNGDVYCEVQNNGPRPAIVKIDSKSNEGVDITRELALTDGDIPRFAGVDGNLLVFRKQGPKTLSWVAVGR